VSITPSPRHSDIPYLGCDVHACPCGFFGDSSRECSCSVGDIKRYRKKISGPLLDRMDIHVHVPRLEYNQMTTITPTESSSIIGERVALAREVQYSRKNIIYFVMPKWDINL